MAKRTSWNKGKHWSPEVRKKLSDAWDYKKHVTEKVRAAARITAKKYLHTPETARKISLALTGKHLSDSHKKHLSTAVSKNPPMYWKGRKKTKEHIAKIVSTNRRLGNYKTLENHRMWGGGKCKTTNGYVWVKSPNHPRKDV